MRRKLPLVVLVVLLALATAGVAAAATGGFTPEHPHSPNAYRINQTYYVILGLTAGIFVLVETLLLVFIWRYRSRGRPRTVEGAQVHGHTRLELMWTAGPVLILAGVSGCLMPSDQMPEQMRKVSQFTPHAWALDAYQRLLIDQNPNTMAILADCGVLAGFGLLFLAVSRLLLKLD